MRAHCSGELMPQDYSRTQRVGDYLKRELAQLIQHDVRDPRIGMVNINEVEVSHDLAHAKIYVTFVGERSEHQNSESLSALNKAAGFFRSHVAKSNHMRTTPKLFFIFDSSVQRGAYLTALIDKAIAADAGHTTGLS